MFGKLLRWFYCLPVPLALMLLLVFSLLFLYLRKKIEKKRFWLLGVLGFALLWFLFIASVTLTSRGLSERSMVPELIPFHSYFLAFTGENRELLRSNFMNIALFYPAGLVVCELLPMKWRSGKNCFSSALCFFCSAQGSNFVSFIMLLAGPKQMM